MERESEWSEKKDGGEGTRVCVWRSRGAKGVRNGGSEPEKQIHKSQPDFQKCENLYKTISSNNWQDWIDEKQRRRSERQSRATEWGSLPPIHFQISSSTVPCTLLITGQAFPCHLFTHNKRPIQTHRWNMPAAWGSRPIMALSWAYFCLPQGERRGCQTGKVGGGWGRAKVLEVLCFPQHECICLVLCYLLILQQSLIRRSQLTISASWCKSSGNISNVRVFLWKFIWNSTAFSFFFKSHCCNYQLVLITTVECKVLLAS